MILDQELDHQELELDNQEERINMADAITLDVTDQLNTFNKLASSMPFIISKSMNDLSFEKGRKDLSNEMKKDLTERNKSFFNPSRIRVKKSH